MAVQHSFHSLHVPYSQIYLNISWGKKRMRQSIDDLFYMIYSSCFFNFNMLAICRSQAELVGICRDYSFSDFSYFHDVSNNCLGKWRLRQNTNRNININKQMYLYMICLYVLVMFQKRVGDVVEMCWGCFKDVLAMFWACFSDVLGMFQ